ncbi:MAG: alpha/beta fold hydrolase [Anaerolineales bacterium]|nr:MAG: alpha/beta fold hydrolase [Anaerolineales bacterium]
MATLELTEIKQQGVVKKVYQAFFSPSKYEVKPTDEAVLARGNAHRIPFDGGELAVTTWGDKRHPAVLLMHGWGGARAQMTGFVEPLLNAGYRVVAYDQPAHGESDGVLTNLLEIAPSMGEVMKREGRFEAIIAHSFGTLITSYALVNLNFPPPSKLVYFGAFNRLLDSLPRFQAIANLPDEVVDGMRMMIIEKFGEGVLEAVVNETLTPRIHIPALMFHDASDNVTPIEDSRAIAKAWKSAKLIETSGLGHRGALQSKEIHEQVVGFLTGK